MLSRLLKPRRRQRHLNRHKLFVVQKFDFLDHPNVTVNNKTILFKNCPDITLSECRKNGGRPSFPNAETVFAIDCNKNFVYYYINKFKLPKMRTLYLASPPCDPRVLNNFQHRNTKIYLSNFFLAYFHRWGNPKIELVKHDKIIDMANSYHKEFFEDLKKENQNSEINFNNCAQCRLCCDIITSLSVKDFKECFCGSIFVSDGDNREKNKKTPILKYIENEEQLEEAKRRNSNFWCSGNFEHLRESALSMAKEEFINHYNEHDIVFLENFYKTIKCDH